MSTESTSTALLLLLTRTMSQRHLIFLLCPNIRRFSRRMSVGKKRTTYQAVLGFRSSVLPTSTNGSFLQPLSAYLSPLTSFPTDIAHRFRRVILGTANFCGFYGTLELGFLGFDGISFPSSHLMTSIIHLFEVL